MLEVEACWAHTSCCPFHDLLPCKKESVGVHRLSMLRNLDGSKIAKQPLHFAGLKASHKDPGEGHLGNLSPCRKGLATWPH